MPTSGLATADLRTVFMAGLPTAGLGCSSSRNVHGEHADTGRFARHLMTSVAWHPIG